MSNNLSLWSEFEKTDPNHTKQFSGKAGFSGTAINGTWILKRLTEKFGPCGRGWKFVLEDERVEDGHFISDLDRAKLHIVRGHLTYCMDGQWYDTSPQFGQTMLVGSNKYGVYTDEEAPKKSITDCISKCAVLLGIGADVHMGLYDDNKYVNALREEFEGDDAQVQTTDKQQAPKATKPAEAGRVAQADKAKDAAIAFGQKALTAINGFRTIEEMKAWESIEIQDKIARLKQYSPELHAQIIEALKRADERLG
jgi:hypothetical protein